VISTEGSKACNTPGNLSQSQSLQFPYASFEDCSMAALVYCPLVTFITKVSVPFKSHCSNINSSPKYILPDNNIPMIALHADYKQTFSGGCHKFCTSHTTDSRD
ncbi:hypothetical protein SUGI_0686580, partial [Cryptomeria japonica]